MLFYRAKLSLHIAMGLVINSLKIYDIERINELNYYLYRRTLFEY